MNRVQARSDSEPAVHPAPTSRAPGDLFLHPLPLVAAATLAINDIILKTKWPGVLTGKLSDVAGLFVFPIILVCLTELARKMIGRRWQITDTGIVIACVLTAVTFTLVKTVGWASSLYATAIGVLRWPFHAGEALLSRHPLPDVAAIDIVRDPTDVIAVIAVIGAGLWMHHHAIARPK